MHKTIGVLVCSFVLVFSGSASGGTTQASDPLRQRVSIAQATYQGELYALLVSEIPDADELLTIQRDLQVALFHRGDLRYGYLWANQPVRINRDGGISPWLNFDWTDEDEKALAGKSEAYVGLQGRIAELKRKNQGHPMWPQVREMFAALHGDHRMKIIHGRLSRELKAIEEGLAGR